MGTQQKNLIEILNYIDPASLDYQEWVNVGMGLKEAGFTASDWNTWSQRDPTRYHNGECFKKWATFRGAPSPVTAGTIVQMARDRGWVPEYTGGHELAWDDIIGYDDDLVIIDNGWVEAQEVTEPEQWDPIAHLIKYLETLFEAGENVGYVTESWQKDGKYFPTKGAWDRTAGELIEKLNKCKGDIGAVIGDHKPEAGAWIRFNPLDGKGCKNENVTEYRYALVESDTMDLDKQNAIIRELELPVACLVHSGKKSIHAIVKIEAADYDEYRKRVDYLYTVLKKNGMPVDTQNKNPSRLSRMPGVERNGRKQFLIDTNIGKESWNEWKEWIEGINDDLPEPENLASVWDNLPELSPALIEDVLRMGHKMLLAGPSKAGKSYLLMELCCAIAEGKKWLNWQCAQGKVLYVNLELDRASCLHRFKDVYSALGWAPNNLSNIDIWNLRGKAVPMDKLAPKLIRRAAKKNFIAIIIDPIYKVITGDENSADQMAKFCNQFDLVCTELGCSVIYCHHHSKGTQGQKRSMDRASGSGVFARDPDTLLDLLELDMTEALTKQEENKAVCRVCEEALKTLVPRWRDEVSQDDILNQTAALEVCARLIPAESFWRVLTAVEAAKKAVSAQTAWRIEGTLREFPKFPPINIWFDYPVHHIDTVGVLKNIDAQALPPGRAYQKTNKSPAQTRAENAKHRKETIDKAYDAMSIKGEVSIADIVEFTSITRNTIKGYIDEHPGFTRDRKGIVTRRDKDAEQGVKVSKCQKYQN